MTGVLKEKGCLFIGVHAHREIATWPRGRRWSCASVSQVVPKISSKPKEAKREVFGRSFLKGFRRTPGAQDCNLQNHEPGCFCCFKPSICAIYGSPSKLIQVGSGFKVSHWMFLIGPCLYRLQKWAMLVAKTGSRLVWGVSEPTLIFSMPGAWGRGSQTWFLVSRSKQFNWKGDSADDLVLH